MEGRIVKEEKQGGGTGDGKWGRGDRERERKRDGEGSRRMLQQGKLLLKSVMT